MVIYAGSGHPREGMFSNGKFGLPTGMYTTAMFSDRNRSERTATFRSSLNETLRLVTVGERVAW